MIMSYTRRSKFTFLSAVEFFALNGVSHGNTFSERRSSLFCLLSAYLYGIRREITFGLNLLTRHSAGSFCLRSTTLWNYFQWREKQLASFTVSLSHVNSCNTKNSTGSKKLTFIFQSPIESFASHRLPNKTAYSERENVFSRPLWAFSYQSRCNTKSLIGDKLQIHTSVSNWRFGLQWNFLLRIDYHMIMLTMNRKAS